MAQSPSSTATPAIDHTALARRVVEMLLQGGTIAECASEIGEFGGSMLAVHECLDRGMERGAVRRVIKGQQEARTVRLETLKTAALHELWLMAFGDKTPLRGLTADEMRAIEARRRACATLLQLKPFQNATGARDSVQDVPSPRFFDDGRRDHSLDDCGSSDERRTTSDELRTTSDEYGSSYELRVTNDEYGSSSDEESYSREFVNRNEPDLDAIETLANEDPSPPVPLSTPEVEEERTPRLTRQQIRKRARDQRKRGNKKPDGLMSDGSEHTFDTQSVDRLETCRYRLEEGVGDGAHPP